MVVSSTVFSLLTKVNLLHYAEYLAEIISHSIGLVFILVITRTETFLTTTL